MLVRKQTHFSMDFTTEMSFEPSARGQEAGVVVWLSHTVYASLGVRASRKGEKGSLELVYREVSQPEERYGYKRVKDDLPRTVGVLHMSVRSPRLADAVETQWQEQMVPFEKPGPIVLTIKARKAEYELSCSSKASPETVLASGKIKNIRFEPLYVGTHIGIFAQGADWAPCLRPAVFRYAETRSVDE